MSYLPLRRRYTCELPHTEDTPHRLCQSSFNHVVSHRDKCCPFCPQLVAFARKSTRPLCSTCYLALAVFHCFNSQCITGPISTPFCNPYSRTPCYLTHHICPSCAPRPVPFHEWRTFPFLRPTILKYFSTFITQKFLKIAIWLHSWLHLNQSMSRLTLFFTLFTRLVLAHNNALLLQGRPSVGRFAQPEGCQPSRLRPLLWAPFSS